MTLAGAHHQTAAQRGGEAKDKDKPLSDVQRDRSVPLLHMCAEGVHVTLWHPAAAAWQPTHSPQSGLVQLITPRQNGQHIQLYHSVLLPLFGCLSVLMTNACSSSASR